MGSHPRPHAPLGYLRGGFQRVYEALSDGVQQAGCRIEYGTSVQGIEPIRDGVRIETDRGSDTFDTVLCTLPTRLFLRLARGLPDSFVQQHAGGGDHFSATA